MSNCYYLWEKYVSIAKTGYNLFKYQGYAVNFSWTESGKVSYVACSIAVHLLAPWNKYAKFEDVARVLFIATRFADL